LNDFGDDVLPAWEKVRVPRDQWRSQKGLILAKRDEIHALVQRRAVIVGRLQDLEQIYLDECRQALAVHLGGADHPLLGEWAGSDRGVLMGLRKVAGLTAKL